VFNAATDFSTLTLSGTERIHINGNGVFLNQPWIAHSFMDFEGEPHSSTSFSYVNGSTIGGSAYPLFILSEINSAFAVHFSRLILSAGYRQRLRAGSRARKGQRAILCRERHRYRLPARRREHCAGGLHVQHHNF
jgi:hypothetical protein